MKKLMLKFTLSCALLVCVSVTATSQDLYDNQIQIDVERGIRTIFKSDMDKGLQLLRGKQLVKDDDGTLVYGIEADKIKMHADAHYVFVRPGNPMGFYYANYGSDTAILNKSLQAFINFGEVWSDGDTKNPFTVEKDAAKSTGGKLVYVCYTSGIKVGVFTIDEREKKGLLMLGFL